MLEEFVGSPLLAQKLEGSYDVVAQLLNEMCDAGAISTTEPNALRDLVEVEGWIGKLLGGIQIPGSVIPNELEISELTQCQQTSFDIVDIWHGWVLLIRSVEHQCPITTMEKS